MEEANRLLTEGEGHLRNAIGQLEQAICLCSAIGLDRLASLLVKAQKNVDRALTAVDAGHGEMIRSFVQNAEEGTKTIVSAVLAGLQGAEGARCDAELPGHRSWERCQNQAITNPKADIHGHRYCAEHQHFRTGSVHGNSV